MKKSREEIVKQLVALATPDTLAKLTPEERAEFDALLGETPPPGLLSEEHAWQTRMIRDPSRFKVVMCNRRAGKSRGIAGMLLEDAWRHPGSNYLYAGLTISSAKKAIWKDSLVKMNGDLKLGLRFNETDSTCTLPNGALIYVIGMDSSEGQKERARGGKYRIAVADEAQEFTDLDDVVQSILRPAVSDERGVIVLSGTPGQVPTGLFYRLSNGRCAENPERWEIDDADSATRWVGFTWSSLDNPFMAEQARADMDAMVSVNPDIVNEPKFMREWRGMWVTDEDRKVYRYQPGRNDYVELPKLPGKWNYALGVDLGYNDDTAIVAVAWHPHDRCAYIVDCDKRSGFDVTDAANLIRSWMDMYDASIVVVDGQNKQAVEEMRRRYALPLVAADKRGKPEFADIINAEFQKENIKLSPMCDDLRMEYAHLSWDAKAWKRNKRVEDPRARNHVADAAAYCLRIVYSYLAEAAPTEIVRGTTEWLKQEEKAMLDRAERRVLEMKREMDDVWRYA